MHFANFVRKNAYFKMSLGKVHICNERNNKHTLKCLKDWS